MLTPDEKSFLAYWEANRDRKKRSIWQYSLGLPMGVLIILALFVNIIFGWHKRASMIIRSNASIIIVVLIAAVGIVVFMSIFSARHQWDQNEQRYQELLDKQKKEKENLTERL